MNENASTVLMQVVLSDASLIVYTSMCLCKTIATLHEPVIWHNTYECLILSSKYAFQAEKRKNTFCCVEGIMAGVVGHI